MIGLGLCPAAFATLHELGYPVLAQRSIRRLDAFHKNNRFCLPYSKVHKALAFFTSRIRKRRANRFALEYWAASSTTWPIRQSSLSTAMRSGFAMDVR